MEEEKSPAHEHDEQKPMIPLAEVAPVPPLGAPSVVVVVDGAGDHGGGDDGLEVTFRAMKSRQRERLMLSTFDDPMTQHRRLPVLFWAILFGGSFAVYLFFQIFYFDRRGGFVLEFILMGILSLLITVVIRRLRIFVKVIIVECYAALLVFFLSDFYYQPKSVLILAISLISAVLATVLSFWVYWTATLCVHRCSCLVRRRVSRLVQGRYEIEQELACCACCAGDGPTVCVYEGETSPPGTPHGRGAWIDSSFRGESLTGFWEHGFPVGPFESIENDSRCVLANLRLIVGTNAGGRNWLDRRPLAMGVCSVECSVSGGFLRSYPKVTWLSGPTQCSCDRRGCRCIADIFDHGLYRHIDDGRKLTTLSVAVDRRDGSLVAAGHQPLVEHPKSIAISVVSTPSSSGHEHHLIVHGPWLGPGKSELGPEPSAEDAPVSLVGPQEALLFIHGYDHSLSDAVKRFGQFLALAHLPSYLRPFVFNWPASSSQFLYWCAMDSASDTDLHRDLKTFLEALANAGIRQLSVMCHSLGCRFWLRAFPTVRDLFAKISMDRVERSRLSRLRRSVDGATSGVYQSPRGGTEASTSRARGEQKAILLTNLILLNPDHDLETFVNDVRDLQEFVVKISVYADSRDAAVKLSETLSSRRKLGLITSSSSRRKATPHPPSAAAAAVSPAIDQWPLPDFVDVIDTGDLDRNINETAHGFFNLNSQMVADLGELVVTGKPADERSSRLKRCGHVFRFTIVPSSVLVV